MARESKKNADIAIQNFYGALIELDIDERDEIKSKILLPVAELREPNPPRGSMALMEIAANMLEKLELENFRLKNQHSKEENK